MNAPKGKQAQGPSMLGVELEFNLRKLLIIILMAVMIFGIIRGDYVEAWSNASTL